MASLRIEETPVRAEPEEAGASWGAPVEANPQHAELELAAVTPGSHRADVTVHASLADAAKHIIEDALEEIALAELASLPGTESIRRASLIKPIANGLYYEIRATWEDGWVERLVVRADKTSYYTKKTHLYLGEIAVPIEINAVYKGGVLYYEVYVKDWLVLEAGYELERLLKREGGI